MTSIKKELYNHSFDDVVNKTDIPEKLLKLESKKYLMTLFPTVSTFITLERERFWFFFYSQFYRLCRSAVEIYRAAQSAERGGDEELAFILYMRYINIIKSLQKKADFRNKQAELTEMFGGNKNLLNALDTAEALQKSLIPR